MSHAATRACAGFTTAAIFPTHGIFGGQGSLVDLAGQKPADMVLVPSVGQYIAMHPSTGNGGFPGALMGVIAHCRQTLLDTGHYQRSLEFFEKNDRVGRRPAVDPALEALVPALGRRRAALP